MLRDLPNRSLTRRKRPRLDDDADIKLGFAARVGIGWQLPYACAFRRRCRSELCVRLSV